MFSWCQSHQNIDILVPRITTRAAKQRSWCQDINIGGAGMVPSQQLSSQAGAKMPRYQDFLRARGHLLPLVRFPWVARGSKNRPFWYPDTKMARYHENLLFTIQKLCFQGAKATKISIFWYPESRIKPPRAPIEQPSGTQAGRYSRHGSPAAR